jgi:hypothetical protein
MTTTTRVMLTVASAIAMMGAASVPAVAQTAAKKPATKAVAKKAPSRSVAPAAGAATGAAAAAAPSVSLSPEQLSIAQIVTTGRIPCGEGKSVTLTADTRTQGAFDLAFSGARYDVVPIPTASGAVRLEDKKSGLVYMQLANKSMLFNEKQSRRLADDCQSDQQKAVADQMAKQPGVSVLDAPAPKQ